MSSTWLDVPEAESFDGYGGDEAVEGYLADTYGDGEALAESDDDAESRYSRRRRRARRLARARRRRRAALARARYGRMPVGPPTAAAVAQRTEADVASLEVESRVQADTLAAQREQGRAGINAAAASAVVPSLLSFLKTAAPDEADKRYFKAGSSFIPLAPLAFLRSPGRGFSDPRLWAVAAVAGLTIFEDRVSKGRVVEGVEIVRSVNELKAGESSPFRAVAVDENRMPAALPPGATIEWKSEPPDSFMVTKTGDFTSSVKVVSGANEGDKATITAIIERAGTEIGKDFVDVRVVA
jgi:hypothetical protein